LSTELAPRESDSLMSKYYLVCEWFVISTSTAGLVRKVLNFCHIDFERASKGKIINTETCIGHNDAIILQQIPNELARIMVDTYISLCFC